MSRLQELVDELCPEGVEYKPLGEVGTFFRGSTFTKADIRDNGVPCIHYGQIHTQFNLYTDVVVSYLDDSFAARMKRAKPGDLIIATTSEDDEAVGKAIAWLGDSDVVVSNDACYFRHIMDAKYMTYFFCSEQFQKAKMPYITGAKVRRIKSDDMSKITIPVPPIEVQREIVRILDSMQELDDALSAEIETREKQFEWMLQEELSVSHLARIEGQTVKMRAVREVRERVITPVRAKPTSFDGTIPWCKLEDVVGYEIGDSLSGKNVSEETIASMGLNVYPEGTVLCSCSATLGVYCVTQKPLVTNQRFMGFVCSNEIFNRFFMYAMAASTTKLLMQATTGTNAYISRKAFEDHLIPIPSTNVQKRIAEELDSAYHLLNSLHEDRNARRKQFEHYRNKLLAFPEKVS